MKFLEALNKLDIDLNDSYGMLQEVLSNVELEKFDIDEMLEAIDPNNLDYSGACHEQIDGMIDIYYCDLRKWAVDNYEWIDQAIDSGLTSKDSDYHQTIQAGQYEFYSDSFYTSLSKLENDLRNADFNLEEN